MSLIYVEYIDFYETLNHKKEGQVHLSGSFTTNMLIAAGLSIWKINQPEGDYVFTENR